MNGSPLPTLTLPNTPDNANLHHLMRTRVHKALFLHLREIASKETSRTGDYTSVSDLVRSALRNWIQTYEATDRLRSLQKNPKKFT